MVSSFFSGFGVTSYYGVVLLLLTLVSWLALSPLYLRHLRAAPALSESAPVADWIPFGFLSGPTTFFPSDPVPIAVSVPFRLSSKFLRTIFEEGEVGESEIDTGSSLVEKGVRPQLNSMYLCVRQINSVEGYPADVVITLTIRKKVVLSWFERMEFHFGEGLWTLL